MRASGSATARLMKTARNTSPSACPRFRRIRSIGTSKIIGWQAGPMKVRLLKVPAVLAVSGFVFALSVHAAEPKDLTNSVGMKLVRIEAGSFIMGQEGPPADYQMKKHP